MVQKDKFTYIIQYQEVDENRHLRLYTLENYLLNSAGLAADKHGFGVKYLYPQHMTWVLTNLSVEMDSLPMPGDEMVVETWVQEWVHTLSVRNFRIYINGEKKGEARSVWVVLNIDDRTIQSIFDRSIFHLDEKGESLDLPRAPRHVTKEQADKEDNHKISYSDIDYNGHCNSCKYLERMLDLQEPPTDKFPLRIDLRYAKEVYKGENVRICFFATDGAYHYDLYTGHGELSCSAILSFGKGAAL